MEITPCFPWCAYMSSTTSTVQLNKSRVAHAIKRGKISATPVQRPKKDDIERINLHLAHLARAYADAALNDPAGLEAQIGALKEVVALLRAELNDTRAQRDEWRAKAQRNNLAVSIAVASRARAWWRPTQKA
jgi:hypothetical protein